MSLNSDNIALKILARQLKDITENSCGFFKIEAEDLMKWTIYLKGTPETPYEGGIFKLLIEYSEDYPYHPPKVRVLSDFFHPNVYKDGRIDISLLQPPEDISRVSERPCERWLPIYTAETILLSFMSVLSDPVLPAPSNVEASVMYRSDRKGYIEKVKKLVDKSLLEVPRDLVIPPAAPKIAHDEIDDIILEDDFHFDIDSEWEEEEEGEIDSSSEDVNS